MRHSATPVVLAIVFASAYFALGPGCFFSVDEVVVEEMARAVYQRGNLEIPAIDTAIQGEGGAHYAHRGPALGYIAVPFVAIGSFLDNRLGSFQGGTVTGSPLGTLEHPLRWGGRFSIFTALIANALIGGLAVAVLYLIALRMNVAHSVALAFSISAGVATLLASESTHFFQHPLEALGLLCGFWFLSGQNRKTLAPYAWLGGLSLGVAVLARPNAAAAAAIIWLYGAIVVRTRVVPEDRRLWLLTLGRSAGCPAASAVLFMVYNFVQFGGFFKTGYGDENGIFRLTLSGPIKALLAYLFGPTLSVFLFAPPLLLIPLVWRHARNRWPCEMKCLLLASVAHFASFAFLPVWDGFLAYGPRYALAPMLLLMPLTLPAFEKAFKERLPKWRRAVILLIIAGALVQVVGLSVYVATNEWYYHQHNIYENRAFIFIPSASPVWVHLRELLGGRNLIPWAFRAISSPGAPLTLLTMLGFGIAAGCRFLWISHHPENESWVPGISMVVISALVLLGFLASKPIDAPVQIRIANYVSAGSAAQQARHEIEAEELHALVLSLDPGNKFALHNLGLLYEKAGKMIEAVTLYERALRSDPAFSPAIGSLARYGIGHRPGVTDIEECVGASDCYQAGRRSWDEGDKDRALRIWERAAQQFPAEAWLIRDVARARYDLADYEGAVHDYLKAIALSPSDSAIRTDLAWALLAGSRFEEARQICNDVLTVDPENAPARAILARLPK